MAKANDRAAAMAMLDKMLAKQEAANAKVKVTKAEIKEQAQFLLGWAKSKQITHYDSTFYKSGKWMCKMVPAMVQGLLDAGYVTGTKTSFKVNKEAVAAIK